MIDLHSHTNESDGDLSPAALVDEAIRIGLEALAITDHDTFAGYDQAAPIAQTRGLDLVCGVELNTRLKLRLGPQERQWSIHLLGYFLHNPASTEFRRWLDSLVDSRRERNARLIEKLRANGLDIELHEVEAVGRTLTGRPHFARVLVNKGYVSSSEEAFRDYLGETAPTFVDRDSADTATGIQQILAAGGLPVLAHPVRLGVRDPEHEARLIGGLRDAGLRGLEVQHPDHRPADVERYKDLARKLDLAVTGGSDFHGAVKPNIRLGSGVGGNVNVGLQVLTDLRNDSAHLHSVTEPRA